MVSCVSLLVVFVSWVLASARAPYTQVVARCVVSRGICCFCVWCLRRKVLGGVVYCLEVVLLPWNLNCLRLSLSERSNTGR